MNDYTPTTDEVREDFAFPWSPEQIGDRSARVAAFDRWLAAHDAGVLRSAADRMHQATEVGWLRDRAHRIAASNESSGLESP